MKRFLLPILAILVYFGGQFSALSQTGSPVVTLFTEDFEAFPHSMTGDTTLGSGQWDTTSRIASTGNYCDTNFASGGQFAGQGGGISYLTSPVIDVTGYVSLNVAFDHICYIEVLDDARLEVSFDGGVTWIKTGSYTYKGTSALKQDSSFSKFSQANLWHPSFNDTSWVPSSTSNAWVTENFDITNYLTAPGIVSSDSLMIRFSLFDDPTSVRGRVGSHTWYVDDIVVTGATCELIPPTINLAAPFRYIEQYEDVVYFTGPYDFSAQFRDASLIDSAYLAVIYKGQGGAAWVYDTIQFNVVAGSNYFAEIPAQTIGDTVCYKLVAVDASPCMNRTVLPTVGYTSFLVRDNLPPGCQTKPIFDFPHYETFNSPDFQLGSSGTLANNWINSTGDFHDWWVGSGTTPTPGTGPTTDYPGPNGKYLYVEASPPHQGDVAVLLSPCIDLYQIPNASVKFYLNMDGIGGDSLHVDLYDPAVNAYINDIITPLSGNKGPNWFDVEFNLYKYRNSISQLRFRGVGHPSSDLTDIALDSFKIIYSPIRDIRVESILLSPFNPEGEQDSIQVAVRNLGVVDATQADIFFQVFDDTLGPVGPVVQVPWTGSVVSDSLAIFNVSTTYTVPSGDYFIQTWVKMPMDERANNDTSFLAASIGLPYRSVDFHDNYDADSLWLPVPKESPFGNVWQYGTPSAGSTNSAFSDSIAWDINLTKGYNGNGELVSLYSPFFDFRGADSMLMYFYNNREAELNSDGVFIEYSFDNGVSWDSLKGISDVKRKHWYNSNISGGPLAGTPIISGNSRTFHGNFDGWVETEVLLEDIFNNTNYVMFRFNFYAARDEDGGDGISIDNFRIIDPVPQNAEAVKIITPSTGCEIGDNPRNIKAILKNVGDDPMINVPITITVTRTTGDNLTVNNPQVANETVDTTVSPRDRIKFESKTAFDFSAIGDYTIEIVTNLPNDPKFQNDTMRKEVEHFEGCDVRLAFSTSTKPMVRDSSRWRLEAKMDGRTYIYTEPYAGWMPMSFYGESVCVKDGARVKFQLGDVDTSISNFSVIGYDTMYVENGPGGPAASDANFDWICPPQLSATVKNVILDQGAISFPIAKDYEFEVVMRNNGLDSIDNVNLRLFVDNAILGDSDLTFPPPAYPAGLRFRRTKKINFGTKYLSPGLHEIMAVTSDPNDTLDRKMSDDTLITYVTIIDTVLNNLSTTPYCSDFETNSTPLWLSLNPYTYSPNNSFVLGSPTTTNVNGTHSGTQAWTVLPDSNYHPFDSASFYSPYFQIEKDSCYKFNFYHNYSFDDQFHDGGHVQFTVDSGNSWHTIDHRGQPFALNWYNTPHVVAIPGNQGNAGWTGVSNGYVQSQNVFGLNRDAWAVLRWRFESDGSVNGEGWSVDDFCIERNDPAECEVVGLDENTFNPNALQLGQNIPNPASNSTSVPFYLPKTGQMEFVVVNLLGQVMYQESGQRSAGDQLIKMDLNNFSDGVYFYWMIFENQKLSNKMIISK